MTYLFGNIVLVDAAELQLLHRARRGAWWRSRSSSTNRCWPSVSTKNSRGVRGVNVAFYYMLLLVLVALTVVTLIYVVGIVLVIALLTLPVVDRGPVRATDVADDGCWRRCSARC